jgi:hypothetical protein
VLLEVDQRTDPTLVKVRFSSPLIATIMIERYFDLGWRLVAFGFETFGKSQYLACHFRHARGR